MVKDIPQGNSSIIKFRRFGNLAANVTPLEEGVTPEGKQMSKSDITAEVKQYGDFVTMTDKVLLTGEDPLLTEAAGELGDQAGDSLDQITRDVLLAGTVVQYASTATDRDEITAAMVMSANEIYEAERTLKNAKARRILSMINASTGYNTDPVASAYILIVHPNTTFDLQKSETKFVPIERYAAQGSVMPGEVGKIGDVRIVETPNGKVFAGEGAGSVDVYGSLLLAKEAYGISRISGAALENIVTPLGSAGSNDPLRQRATSGWKATFAAARLNETFMVRIEHGVTA